MSTIIIYKVGWYDLNDGYLHWKWFTTKTKADAFKKTIDKNPEYTMTSVDKITFSEETLVEVLNAEEAKDDV
jgi:hypothetical protein